MAHYDWKELYEGIEGCTKCRLCEKRSNIVIGEGDPKAALFTQPAFGAAFNALIQFFPVVMRHIIPLFYKV